MIVSHFSALICRSKYAYFPGNASISDFTPIPDLLSGDEGDITLVALKNTVGYTSEVQDPWFSATTPFDYAPPVPYYSATDRFSFLGCVEKYQVCSDGSCSPFTGYYDLANKSTIASAEQKPTQNSVFSLIYKALWAGQINFQVTLLDQDILLASKYLCKPSTDLLP